jgi:hypothetical protein
MSRDRQQSPTLVYWDKERSMKRPHFSADSKPKRKTNLKKQAVRISKPLRKSVNKTELSKDDVAIPQGFPDREKDQRYIIWASMALFLVLGLTLYSLLPSKPESVPVPEDNIAVNKVPLVDAAAVVDPSEASNKQDSTESALADGENARAMISDLRREDTKPDMEAMFHQAEEFHASGNPTDAYLLYFYLAKKGHGPSAMALAVTSDPVFFTQSGALNNKPDPFQAYKWYHHAVKAGVPQAQENLDNLKDTIEAVALSGDRSAQRLLLQWQ